MRIVLHANAVHLQAGPDARTIRHIVVRPLDGKAREVKARHYVLACGAIENARLLLASNDVEAQGIGNRHDQVGRYFMEHPTRPDRPRAHGPALRDVGRVPEALHAVRAAARPGAAAGRRHAARARALNSVATFKLQRPPALGVPLGNRIYQNLKHGIAPESSRARARSRLPRRARPGFTARSAARSNGCAPAWARAASI